MLPPPTPFGLLQVVCLQADELLRLFAHTPVFLAAGPHCSNDLTVKIAIR